MTQITEQPDAANIELLNNQIKLATFNLLNYLAPPDACYEFDRIYSSEQWSKKQAWINHYLQIHSPDIIGFQEVFSIHSLQQLVAAQGYDFFAVVDEPSVEDEFIYRDPVVAIASRFPIVEVSRVTVDQGLIKQLGLAESFALSREILRATVQLPHLGETDCYVVHFKSKRVMWENTLGNEPQDLIFAALQEQTAGRWAASIQRGSEAALLQHQLLTRRVQTGNALLVMGDFNNSLDDGILSHLITDKLFGNLDREQQTALSHLVLRDAWQLYLDNLDSEEREFITRPATHYFGEKGSVLDYILLSSEFDASSQRSFFEVSEYVNTDHHLISPNFELDSESTDHAVVSVVLTLRE